MSKSYKHDLTGQRFGRLTVLEFVPNDKPSSYWKCKCDCGNTSIVWCGNLKNGTTKSCGCWNRERAFATHLKHGKYHTRLRRIWQQIKDRCNNSKTKIYKYYGGRGITVCDEWKNDFQAFYDWAMTNGYSDSLTIDRINYNGNYEPSNCRWVDMTIQNRNKKNNIVVECHGNSMCLAEASEVSGINCKTLYTRYYRGDRGDRLFRPVDKKKSHKK